MNSNATAPILTAHLFPKLQNKLLELLQSLNAPESESPTIVPGWTVRSVAAHMLDTQLRKLSIVRDGYAFAAPASPSASDVRKFVDELNAEGVRTYGRLSPKLLIRLLDVVGKEFCEFIASLDPFQPAMFAVSWAGESESANWFDTARDLTEYWHHQQQIRFATGREGIMIPELYRPVLETFMRALPYSYRNVEAPIDSGVRVIVAGECGGEWYLLRDSAQWRLSFADSGTEVARIEVPQEIAWRIFTKGISAAEAISMATISGEKSFAQPFFHSIAIVG